MASNSNAIYIRFDDAYAIYAMACLNSIRANYPDHPKFIIDYRGGGGRILDLLSDLGAELLPTVPPPEYTRYLQESRAGSAVFDRLGLWRSAFRRFDTILHLDADMLVLHPLHDLFECTEPHFVSNHESSFGVHVFSEKFRSDARLREMLIQDNLAFLDGPDDMVNAGLFTLPRKFRTPGNIALLANLARRYGRYLAFSDQSLLSLWLVAIGGRPTLDFADNFQTPFFSEPDVAVPLDEIRVLHFSSHRKPGTRAFDKWDRVGEARAWIAAKFECYRGDV